MKGAEDEITAWFTRQRQLSEKDFPIGIGDDMAEVRIGTESVFITTDMLLDGTHFETSRASLEQIGYKAMAVSLSDCAAMATEPVAAVVSVALPRGFGKEQIMELHGGIVRAGDKFGCSLIGGDITSWKGSERFAISVAMLSRRAGNEPIRRSGAKAGDAICVTGSLGGSGQGRHLEFEPRVKEAIQIAQTAAVNSMIDISDGLSSDLNRICAQSGVGAIIEAELIPISPEAQRSDDPLAAALNEGEDFELLFTLSAGEYDKLMEKWSGETVITRIGTITEQAGMRIKTADGNVMELKPAGFDHLES